MTQKQSILDMDEATAAAWVAELMEMVERGDIRAVVHDGVTVVRLMPWVAHRAANVDVAIAKALIEDAFARVIAAQSDNN